MRRLICGFAALTMVSAGALSAVPAAAITSGSPIGVSDLGPLGNYSWLVRLTDAGGDTVCTGSLISSDWVLTAAHCIDDGITGAGLGLDAPVAIDEASTAVHPNYDAGEPTAGFDAALIRLSTPTTRTPVMLGAVNDSVSPGATVVIAGWGLTPSEVPTSPRDGTSTVSSVSAELIMAEPAPSLVCSGDSGGPLIADAVLVGVASFGDPQCTQFAGFSRMQSLRSWVLAVTGVGSGVPVVSDSEVSVGVDRPRMIERAASDPEDDVLSYSIVTPPTHGTLSVCLSFLPECRYTPAPGYTGPDSFVWTAADGSSTSESATVTIDVRANAAPVGASAIAIASANGSALLPIAATDPDGDPLRFTVVSAPTQGALTGSCDDAICALTYTAAPGRTGTESIAWTVSDGIETSGPYLATVKVDSSGGGLAIEPITTVADAATLAATIAGSDPVSNAVFTGDTGAAGRFDNGAAVFDLEQGVVLGSGRVADIVPGNPDLPDTLFETAGTSLLDRLGATTSDAAVLEYDTVPSGDVLTFRYVFASVEYFYGKALVGFDDAAAISVGGVPCTVPGGTIPSNLLLNQGIIDLDGTPAGGAVNPSLFKANPEQIGTSMTGLSVAIECSVPVASGVPVHVAIAVADRSEPESDGRYDSAILVEGSWSGVSPTPAALEIGIPAFTVAGHRGTTKFKVTVKNTGDAPYAFDDAQLTVSDSTNGTPTGQPITAYAPVAKVLAVGATATVVMVWLHGDSIALGQDHTLLACVLDKEACAERAVAFRYADTGVSLTAGGLTSASTSAKVAVRVENAASSASTVRPADVSVVLLVNGVVVPTTATNTPLATRKLLRPGRATRFVYAVSLPTLAPGDVVTILALVSTDNDPASANNRSEVTSTLLR